MNPPAEDELEITLLGRGVGECVVAHLFDGNWIIVDSFRSYKNSKRPAARVYLDEIGVLPAQVKTLVVTHFHVDHFRGIEQLHDYYNVSRLMVTDALRADQFLALYSDPAEILGELPGTVKRAKARVVGALTAGLRHLKIGQDVYQADGISVKALSPTDAAVLRSNEELAAVMATNDRVAVTSKLKDDNRCSVVLHIAARGLGIMLCADLVADAPEYGWQAVLDEPNHEGLYKSSLVKVGHHGSHNADHPAIWDELVEPNPTLLVAPYWPSRLPRETDVVRMRGCCSELWQAAPSARRIDDGLGNMISSPPTTGVLQARRRPDDPTWRVLAVDPAFLTAS